MVFSKLFGKSQPEPRPEPPVDEPREDEVPDDAADESGLTEQRVEEHSRFRIPHVRGVLAARGDVSAVRTPGHLPETRAAATAWRAQPERFLTGPHVEHATIVFCSHMAG